MPTAVNLDVLHRQFRIALRHRIHKASKIPSGVSMHTKSPLIKDDAVYLVDGSGYIFRAYYANRPLSSSKGVPTNATYGFIQMLLKLLREHQPKYLAIAFDTKTPTFRHQL